MCWRWVTSGCATRRCAPMTSPHRPRPRSWRRSPSPGDPTAHAPACTYGAVSRTHPIKLHVMGRLPLALLAAAVLLAGCGGTDNSDKDPASQVPATGGLREKVRSAQSVTAADFPATGGRTLQEVANSVGSAGPELGMATSVFTPGAQPRGVRDDRQQVRLRLRQDRALRRAQAERQGGGPVPRARRRADDRGALPLQAGGHGGRPVRGRLRRAGAVQEARQVLDPRRHQGRREDRRRPRPGQRGHEGRRPHPGGRVSARPRTS